MMSGRGNGPERETRLGNIGHIRVYVRPRDVPRWNRIFEKSGKSNNPALLEWMMQLAEEKLDLDANQSRLEWSQEMKRIENGELQSDLAPAHDEEVASDPGDAQEDIEMDSGSTPEINGDGGLSDGHPGSLHRGEEKTRTVENAAGEVSVADVRINHLDYARGAEVQRRVVPVVDVTEQITVEKKGSNAPIRKRFRLRVSAAPTSTTTTADVTTVSSSEANQQKFREPLKVRRKQEKNLGNATHVLLQAMTLRSREKEPAVTNGQPKKGSKSNSDSVTPNGELSVVTIEPEASSRLSVSTDPVDPTKATPRVARPSTKNHRASRAPDGELKTFTCSQCPRVFKNATSHRRHERAHRKPTEYPCNSCDKKFTTSGSLWHHRKTQHEEKLIECPHCDQKFAVKRFLRLHLRKHTGEKPYRCKYCDMGFSLKSTLRNHEPTHLDLKHFLCDICGQSFRRKDNLKQHVARRHGQSMVYECDTCGKKFNVASSLANHLIHHQNEKTGHAPYECNLCGKRFTTPNGQKHHMSLHRMKKDHICETCGKVFKMKYYLTKHQAIHLRVKPHNCTICEKGFTQKSNLDIHMRTHTGIKPYSCKVCGKAFAHNVSLKGHVASCHSESSDAGKPYSCRVCGKSFANNLSLKGHVASCHSDLTEAGEPYSCRVCGETFANNASLEGHVATCHSNSGDAGRLYSCRTCGKTFANDVSLRGHLASCRSGTEDTGRQTENIASTVGRQSPQKKLRRNPSLPERDPVSSVVEHSRVEEDNANPDRRSESQVQVVNLPTTDAAEAAAVMTLRGLAEGSLPLVEPRELEETIDSERKDGVLDSSNLVIDEEHYDHDLPDLDNSLSAASCPDENQRGSIAVVCMPQDIPYNLTGFLPLSSQQVGTDKHVQYVTAPVVSREVPQSLSSGRPDETMSQSNGLEVQLPPPSPSNTPHPHQPMNHLVQSGYPGNHHLHPGNLVTYSRHPLGSPSLNQQATASPLMQQHQQEHTLHPPPPPTEQNRISQHLTANVSSSHENLSPQPLVQANDHPVSPGIHQGIQVDNNGLHQASNYPPQNINFLPSFHPQPQPLTLTAQSAAPLLPPNLIRKEHQQQQSLLVEGFPQNLAAAMIPFRAIAPETAAQMVQDQQRMSLPTAGGSNLQPPPQPVHLPYRYIEYSQSLGEVAPSPHDRVNSLTTSAPHFSKAQTNLPPSRMTPSLQTFSFNPNFAPTVSAAMVEQQQHPATRTTPSFESPQGQRSPAFVSSGQLEGIKEVDGNLGQGAENGGGWRLASDVRWEASHLHQMPAGQGRDMVNIPPQLHRQLLTEYSRKMMPYHAAVVSSQSQQPIWESASSQQ